MSKFEKKVKVKDEAGIVHTVIGEGAEKLKPLEHIKTIHTGEADLTTKAAIEDLMSKAKETAKNTKISDFNPLKPSNSKPSTEPLQASHEPPITNKLAKSDITQHLSALNEKLKEMGLLEIDLVSPKDCIAQRVNARYFTIDKFEQLVENIKRQKTLESVPLVFQNEELAKSGKYEIISGHHRIEAAKEAEIPLILVMVVRDIDRQELVSKQLAHNALVGTDDKGILKQLFDSLETVDLKMASGLSDEIAKITYESLSFKVGTFKSFLVMFAPNDIEDFDLAAKELDATTVFENDTTMHLADLRDYSGFIDAIIKIKKLENIKSNAVALHRMVEISTAYLREKEKTIEEHGK